MAATIYIIRPWAQTGTTTPIPVNDPATGELSFELGFTPPYQQTLGVDPSARAMPRGQTNQLFKILSTGLQQYQQIGVPNFISTSDNGGSPFPYEAGAFARYLGINYQSLVGSNTALPTDATKWAPVQIEAIRGSATMVAGVAAVIQPLVQAGSKILAYSMDNGVIGTLYAFATDITPGVGFQITSSLGGDAGTVQYLLYIS